MNHKLIGNAAIMILCAVALVFPGRDALAQARRAAGAQSTREAVAIKTLEITKTKSPDFSYSGVVNESNFVSVDWSKILVRFDTDADWTDQLEMRFFIVVKNPKTSAYTMLTGTYVYSDIPKGRNHLVAVYLRPRTLDRYGNVVEQAAVEIYSKGEVVAMRSFPESTKPWWRTANVRSVEGYVLDRSQTPFANIAWDNYEIPKGK